MVRAIKKTKGNSYCVGGIPEGCKYCIQGSKLVLFMTGKCSLRCYYCPLSKNKKGSKKIYADEITVEKDEDLLSEARLINAKGAGLTGGDPILVFDKTIAYIKLLKKAFGKDFHIHLYTTGQNLNQNKAEKLVESGLDEIRFHTEDLDLAKISLFEDKKIMIGYEIPAIPGQEKEIINLIKILEKNKVKFININELEFSETNAPELKKKGFTLKNTSIAAVNGSEETSLKVLKWAEANTKSIKIHYCPCNLKDGVQLKNRFLRRAKNVRKIYEQVDKEGLLVKGVFHIKKGGDIQEIRKHIIKKYKVPPELLEIDLDKNQINTTWYIAEELAPKMLEMNVESGIIKCFPTNDRFIVYSYNFK